MILRGWSWRWSFLQVTKNPGAVVASLPRRQVDSQLHHCTEDINLHHQHLTKKGICRQEVSRISNGCSLSWDRTYTRHVFPATGIGSRAHTQTHTHTWVELLGPTSRPAWHHGTMWAWVTGGLFVFLFKTESISCAPFVLDLRLKKKISLLNSVFTLCERFEGKRKAATQWVDYKLGLSFKQTEFINTEFPHTQLTGPSLLAYYCGSNADEACICTLMRSCVQTLALGLHLLAFYASHEAREVILTLYLALSITSPRCVLLALLAWRCSQQEFGGVISGCHVVLRHVRGDDLGSQCPIEGLQVPEYPLCASCSECGVIALLARVHVGPCVVCPATPTPGTLPNPPVYCLPDPSYHHPAAPHPSPRPTPKPHSPTHIFP